MRKTAYVKSYKKQKYGKEFPGKAVRGASCRIFVCINVNY